MKFNYNEEQFNLRQKKINFEVLVAMKNQVLRKAETFNVPHECNIFYSITFM